MIIKRTANAGVLLELDGRRILMDGVCREVKPYPATPQQIRSQLCADPPDAVLVTHRHDDHYDGPFVSDYAINAAGPVLGPADIPFCGSDAANVGSLRITPVPSRHLGKTEPMGHMSFVVEGSRCVWFLGDASPLLWKNRHDLPAPDVIIAPYAYGISTGWEITKALGAEDMVIVHLPPHGADPHGLWEAVELTTHKDPGPKLHIPAMGETISL